MFRNSFAVLLPCYLRWRRRIQERHNPFIAGYRPSLPRTMHSPLCMINTFRLSFQGTIQASIAVPVWPGRQDDRGRVSSLKSVHPDRLRVLHSVSHDAVSHQTLVRFRHAQARPGTKSFPESLQIVVGVPWFGFLDLTRKGYVYAVCPGRPVLP